jgi:hypothetical protein
MAKAKVEPSSPFVAVANPAATDPNDEGSAAASTATPRKKKRKGKKRKYNKTGLVREALATLSKGASNQEIHDWILKERKVDIPGNHISNIKSNVLKSKKGKRGGGGGNTTLKTKPASSSKTLTVVEVRVLKEMVDRFGAKAVQEAMDLFRS